MSFRDVGRRVLGWWVVRLLLAVLFLLVAVVLRDVVIGAFRSLLALGADAPSLYLAPFRTPPETTLAGAAYSVVAFLVMAALGVGGYVLHAKWVERRTPAELGLEGAGGELGVGFVIGCGLVLSVVGLLAAGGHVRWERASTWLAVVPGLAYVASAALVEELAVRGVVFRLVEEKLGSWGALIASVAAFGALHQSNPNASWTGSLAVAASGGLVLGMSFVLTRRLWLPIGLHFAWNATQLLLGLPVSGQGHPGPLEAHVAGPAVLTGGSFGIEASAIVAVLGVLVAGVMVWRAVRLARVRRVTLRLTGG